MKGKKLSYDTKNVIVVGLAFVVGTFLLALSYNLFFAPNNLVVGGISGLAIIIEYLFGFNSQLFIYMGSIILLIVCYIFIGKKEAEKVLVGSLLYPVFVTFTNPVAKFLLTFFSLKEIVVTVALASLLYGVSNGIIYKYGYSTGGSDVIVRLLCKYFHLSEGKSIFLVNILIILAGGYVFGVDNAVYAAIILSVSSIIVDKMTIGISNTKKFMIYTKKINQTKKVIQEEFLAGYTIFPTIGGYSHVKGVMIMCVIRNRDVNLFKEKILELDPNAFFVISDCYEVQGGVKRSNLPFM